MSANFRPRLTPEQYLEMERAAEVRSEYYGGEVFAMAGGTDNHATLLLAVGVSLYGIARERGCKAYVSDMRLGVTPRGPFAHPDAMATCGGTRFLDDRRDTVMNPVLVVEVLSKATERTTAGLSSRSTRSSNPFGNTFWYPNGRPVLKYFAAVTVRIG